jgi:putative transcriptional regulator
MKTKPLDRIMAGLQEALAHAGGDAVPGMRVHVPATIDVGAIRRRTGLSQSTFAGRIGVAVSTLRNWEQGRRTPDGPARVLLAMLDRNPRVVEETLGEAA